MTPRDDWAMTQDNAHQHPGETSPACPICRWLPIYVHVIYIYICTYVYIYTCRYIHMCIQTKMLYKTFEKQRTLMWSRKTMEIPRTKPHNPLIKPKSPEINPYKVEACKLEHHYPHAPKVNRITSQHWSSQIHVPTFLGSLYSIPPWRLYAGYCHYYHKCYA